MKKTMAILLVAVLVLLVGCGGKNDVPECATVTDTVSGKTLSLGQKKADVDKTFGEPTYNETLDMYEYEEYEISVEYAAEQVSYIESDSDRYSFLNYTPGTSLEGLANNFEVWESGSNTFAEAYYDEQGSPSEENSATYESCVLYRDGEFNAFYLSL